MNKKILFITVFLGVILSIFFIGYQFQDSLTQEEINNSEVFVVNEMPVMPGNSKLVNVSGSVNDGSLSLQEMKTNSDSIILGEVTNKEQKNDMVVHFNVKVLESYKGTKHEEITVIQLSGPSNLLIGDKYVLFLGKQADGNDRTYYVKGANQGIFLIDNNGKIVIKDSIMNSEIEKFGFNNEQNSLNGFKNFIME